MFNTDHSPRDGYMGVIIGWHKKYEVHVELDIRYKTSTSINSNFGRPYYMILCENGKRHYVDEGMNRLSDISLQIIFLYLIHIVKHYILLILESLRMCTKPVQINHRDVGRYFCKFEQTYYVPNKTLTKYYPYDKPNGYIPQDNISNTSSIHDTDT